MNVPGNFHTIARTNTGKLAIYRVCEGRLLCELIQTDFRLLRTWRIRRKLVAAFVRWDVGFLRIEGDVRYDFDLVDAIIGAGVATGTKVFP